MRKAKGNYDYILRLCSLIDDYLASPKIKEETLPEVVVGFCIVMEKVLKIKLYQKNPVLIFENSRLKDPDTLVRVIKNREAGMDTIKIREVVSRCKLVFDKLFSDDEVQVLIDIYNLRNHFVHGHKADEELLLDKENIIKKMGTVWEKIAKQAEILFGKSLVKGGRPKERYSQEELEKVLTEEVEKKIEQHEDSYPIPLLYRIHDYAIPAYMTGEKCPRCGTHGFSIMDSTPDPLFFAESLPNEKMTSSELYKCPKCYLELTKKEYEIAKQIKRGKV